MLEEPVLALEISLRVLRTISSELKNYRVIPMRPDRDYISLVRHLHPHSCFVVLFSVFVFIQVTICSQGMGVIKYVLPPVQRTKSSDSRTGPRTRSRSA